MSAAAAGHTGLRLLISGGGTGGHLFPAVATAEYLLQSEPGSRVLFIGTTRKLDRDTLERYGFTVKTIHSYGFKGKNLTELVKALLVLPVSLLESCVHILSFKPDVVMGVGGYVTGPVIAAAWLLRRPAIIHEQNSVPGLANRKLGKLVGRVCLSLPQSEAYFPSAKAVLTGNPVRNSIIELGGQEPRNHGRRTLAVLGGSQGAHAVNQLVVDAVRQHVERFSQMTIIHQTGPDDEAMVKQAYEELGMDHRVASFFNDMADIYRLADLLVSRAGATTLAEIAVVGKPAILIPYPYAADGHQSKNSTWYTDSGAAVMFEQHDIDGRRLGEEILAIASDEQRYRRMARAMKSLGITDAAGRIVAICRELSEQKHHVS